MVYACRIEMLGSLRVSVQNRQIERFQTIKTGALLSYLALHPGRRHSREAVAELLWPGGEPVAIRNRLNQAVSSLRRQLHPPEGGATPVLIADHHQLTINGETVTTDVQEFQTAITQSGNCGDRAKKIRLLKTAISLYRGDLLDGYYEDWLMPQRMQLSDQYSEALETLVKLYSKSGEPDEAIPFAIQRLKLDVQDANTHCTLMDLYLRADRPKSALRQFEELVRCTEAIPEQAYQLQRRAEREARQSSVEALPKVSSPNRVSGIETQSAEVLVPRAITRFFGREAEIAAIQTAILRGDRLISLLGLGGSGKTRLATESALRLQDRFSGSIFFVSFTSAKSPDQFAVEVSRVLAPQAEPGWETVIKVLSEKSQILLLLDGLEHLIPGIEDEIGTLLDKTPEVQCLVTSCQALAMEGEVQMPLSPLPPPDSALGATIQELAVNPAVALFVSRAQLVRPDFQLTERTAESVIALCQRLEGLPLSLELAATWARTLTPSQMLEQVSSRFDLLESRRKDISPRHRSMRAALDASIGMLSPTQREVFVRSSFFQGGFTADALGHLCDGMDHLTALDILVERSLVSMAGIEVARFSMLEIVKAFAQSQAPADLLDECGWLHADHFLLLAERGLSSDMDREYPNLIAALRWLQKSEVVERALRLAVALTPYWESKGRAREGLTWFAELFRFGESDVAVTYLARAQACAGRLAWLLGDYGWAVQQFESALHGFGEDQEDPYVLDARFGLQMESHRVGDYERAVSLLKDNLELAERLGDRVAIARCWLAIGNASVEQLRWEDARREYELSLSYAREADSRDRIGQALNNLGNLAVLSGQVEAGRQWLGEALEMLREVDHHWHYSMTLIALSKLDLVCGDWNGALLRLLEAIRLSPEENLVIWRVALQSSFVLTASGHYEAAAKLFGFTERSLESVSRGTHPVELAPYDEYLRQLNESLPAARLEEHWRLGRTLTTEEATKLLHSCVQSL